MEKVCLNVNGMSCEHCVRSVKNALSALDGIGDVDVDLEKKIVTVEFDASRITIDIIKNVIDEEGYEVV
jgi:copper chaperone